MENNEQTVERNSAYKRLLESCTHEAAEANTIPYETILLSREIRM